MVGRALGSGATPGTRVLRIVPAFWAVVVLVLLFFGPDGTTEKFGGEPAPADSVDLASIFLFAQNFTNDSAIVRGELIPAWSLHVEMAFYALVPLGGSPSPGQPGRAWSPGTAPSSSP